VLLKHQDQNQIHGYTKEAYENNSNYTMEAFENYHHYTMDLILVLVF
jgi:hypothetical protein